MISLLGSSKMVLLAIENDYCLEYSEVLFVLYLSWFSSVSLGFLHKIDSELECCFPTLGHLKVIKMVQLKGFFFLKHWILYKWLVSKYCECQFPFFLSLSCSSRIDSRSLIWTTFAGSFACPLHSLYWDHISISSRSGRGI